MKFVAIASDAQSGVIVASKEDGAIRNGMWAMTLPLWRLFLLEENNLYFGASHLQRSLP
jgi:hypothetical protein